MIDKITPSSKYLELMEYDDQQRTLDVTFKDGSKYRYLFCFKPIWDALKQAPSHGEFYSSQIKGKLRSVPIAKKTIGRKTKEQRRITPHVKCNGNAAGTVQRAFGPTVNRLKNRS